MAIQVHWARIPASATLSADTIRPATVILELPLGISAERHLGKKIFGFMKIDVTAGLFVVHVY